MMQRWMARGCGALLMGALMGGLAPRADACGNQVYHATQEEVRTVQAAEGTLNQRKFLWAATAVVKTMPAVRQRRAQMGYDELLLPAVRVMSLMTVRTGGKWVERPNDRGAYQLTVKDERSRIANLEWAVESLRLKWQPTFYAHRQLAWDRQEAEVEPGAPKEAWPENPRDATNLGEALEALPKYREEAKRLLEKLAREDLMTSGYGYAALARLRAEAGEEAASKEAILACHRMTRNAAHRVCTLERPNVKFPSS